MQSRFTQVKLYKVQSFIDLGATISKDSSCAMDIHFKIAATMADKIQDNRSISFSTKFKLYNSLVLFIMQYSYRMGTLFIESFN